MFVDAILSSYPRYPSNDSPLSTFGAVLTDGFSVKSSIDTETWGGAGRSSYIVVGQNVSQNTVTMPVKFHGSGFADVQTKIAAFEHKMLGQFVLVPGDGYEYISTLVEISGQEWAGSTACAKTYTLTATRVKPFVSRQIREVLSTGYIDCDSTVQKTDCRIVMESAVGSAKSIMLRVNEQYYYFADPTGTVALAPIVIDGIDKVITINGVNMVSAWQWQDFPFLTPGRNIVQLSVDGIFARATGYVEYYPTFI